MAATKIAFAVRFHNPDTDKVLPISEFGEKGRNVIENYFTSEGIWAQIIAPIGFLEVPTISFHDDYVMLRAVCEMPTPSDVPDTLLDWGNLQADIEYEFGGVECKMELLHISVSVQEGGSRKAGCRKSRKSRKSRRATRKTRRHKTRRC